jgi:adenylate kinase
MKHKIIFVGGVHGVGKTSLCNKVCEELDIDHYSASDLIKKVKNVKFPTNKHIKEIEENQDSLIIAVDNYINCKTVSLLDGHFCLLDSHGKVAEVPMATFLSLSPIAIIVLNDEPSKIYARIKARDGEESGVDGIVKFQESEIKYSKVVSEKLGVPYLLANPFTEGEAIKDFIKNLI